MKIDVAADTTANDVHQSNVAQLWQHVNDIQSLVAWQAAEQLSSNNGKTYEYGAQQPLEDGLSVWNATQAAAKRVTVSNGSKETTDKRYSGDESVAGDVDDNDDREDIYDVKVDGNEEGQVDYDKI
ncbi:unnamed protein product [Ceratitis capitata]|uniref:(Mediterranean fruit fly) hypothetical protein n=1 Tax=Ceratitis capitata TaxID=7213 RepID=A0A811VIY6_CERCA|nr:unnamed protein product [Ceratitis capitata]